MLKMDDKQFEKRMELLKKSYDRMEPKLDPYTVLQQIEENNTADTISKAPSKWQRTAVWVASIASVLLVGILGTSYMIQQPESPATNDKPLVQDDEDEHYKTYEEWLDKVTENYQRQKEEIRKELMVSKDELNALPFIQNADALLDNYTRGKHSAALTKEELQNLQVIERDLLNGLLTPKRVFATIKEQKQLSFDDSFEIYSLYEQPAIQLESFYSDLLEPYEHLFKKKVPSSQYPSDLQAIMEAANNQAMELYLNDEGSYAFKSNPLNGEFAFDEGKYLHPDILGYFESSQKGSLVDEGDELRYTREETVQTLQVLERTLLTDTNPGSNYYGGVRHNLEHTWATLLKGTSKYPALAKDGTVNKAYITFLQEVKDGKYGKVVQQTAATILKELQQQKTSQTLHELSAYDIWQDLLQAKGEKAGFRNYDHFSFIYMDEGEAEQIQKLYQQYVKNDAEAFINQLSPINIVLLYLYAITIDDHALQQALVMPNVTLDTGLFSQIDSLVDFSQVGETNAKGQYPLVSVRLKQDVDSKPMLIKLSKNNKGYPRIIGIAD